MACLEAGFVYSLCVHIEIWGDMKEVNVRDAREQLSSILKEVERGEEVCILRRGRPVARVVRPAGEPPGFRSRANLRQSVPAMREVSVDTVRTLRDTERY